VLKKTIISGMAALFLIGISSIYAGSGNAAFAAETNSSCCSKIKCSETKNDAGACKTAHEFSRTNMCCSHAEHAKCAKMTASAIKKISSKIHFRESKRLVLRGKYVCGKCDLSKLDFCQGFLRTSKGDLYPLLGNNEVQRIKRMTCGSDSRGFEVVALVKIINGVKYLDVKTFIKI
jgi:hypothetical protein